MTSIRKGIYRMLGVVILVILMVSAWYVYEASWDRRLFDNKAGCVCQNLKASEASHWLKSHPEAQVLDVRSANEFSQGALPHAIHISIGDEAFEPKVMALDRSKPVLVYCAGGYRSRKAVEKLKQLGFMHIQHLHRGYLSWVSDKKT